MKDKFEIKIEHGIPMQKARGSKITEALSQMKVGDSFLYPEDKRTNIAGNAKRLNMKMVSRKTGAGDGMVRVWRVK